MAESKIGLPQEKIEAFCRKWHIQEFALFGSALREDFHADSDIDVLVSFRPEARWTLFDHVDMQEELKEILGRDVDLVSKRGLEKSHNDIRRRAILESARVIYAAS